MVYCARRNIANYEAKNENIMLVGNNGFRICRNGRFRSYGKVKKTREPKRR